MDETEHAPFDAWAVVEMLGHRVVVGRVTEQVIAGAGFVRVDVPHADAAAEGWAMTRLIGTSSIYCITPLTERVARDAARRMAPDPVTPWGYPTPPQPRLDGMTYDPDAEDDDEPVDGGIIS